MRDLHHKQLAQAQTFWGRAVYTWQLQCPPSSLLHGSDKVPPKRSENVSHPEWGININTNIRCSHLPRLLDLPTWLAQCKNCCSAGPV